MDHWSWDQSSPPMANLHMDPGAQVCMECHRRKSVACTSKTGVVEGRKMEGGIPGGPVPPVKEFPEQSEALEAGGGSGGDGKWSLVLWTGM